MNDRRRLCRVLALAVTGALLSGSVMAALDAPAAEAAPAVVAEDFLVRYEAETYPGPAGANATDATCSNGSRRATTSSTGALVSIPITLPAYVTSVVIYTYGQTASAGTGIGALEVTWDGADASSINTAATAAGTCATMALSSAYYVLPAGRTAGAHTIAVRRLVASQQVDYVSVSYTTDPPATTTTTAAPTTTTTAAPTTTTTAAPTTTTTAAPTTTEPCLGVQCTGVSRSGFQAFFWFASLVFGGLFGRILWGFR